MVFTISLVQLVSHKRIRVNVQATLRSDVLYLFPQERVITYDLKDGLWS